MSVTYRGVHWNRQKRVYDLTFLAALAIVLVAFISVSAVLRPNLTVETLILRATALGAILLLHVILCIGPLARLNPRYVALLYNRRHLGVTMFLLALVHATLAIVQYHMLGPVNPLVSVFTAYQQDYWPFARPGGALSDFPFEPFGALALVILFLMAATSHDFWLRNLGASFWKALHVLVYVAYGSLLVHVTYGVLQSERSPVYVGLLVLGFLTVFGLHLVAHYREPLSGNVPRPADDGFLPVCAVDEVIESRGKPVTLGGNRIAVFRHEGKLFAMSNTCRHQGGPVGEGRIIDGCVTCPWHGWQYRPETGTSPPPFHEVLPTYRVRVADGTVYVHPDPQPPETVSAGAPT
jgi:nitrite reductase/ring-hydroxylating ferredoxin subunit/DMSO/TMAO reductase YedYZ heme-binding membrane subunit